MKWLIPPILWVLSVLCIIIIRLVAPPFELVPPPFHWLGAIALLGGLALAIIGSRAFEHVGTNIQTFENPDTLVTTGLFAVSRNPMYLGFVISLLGCVLMANHIAGLIVIVFFFAVCQAWYIPYEEAAARKVFGASYADYCRKVRRWL